MPDAKPDLVRGQYESWVYPEPVSDLTDLVRNSVWNGGDPKNLGKAYWPDLPVRKGLEILVAGCGTYAAALYALNNPDAIVTAVDVSQSSLEHSDRLKKKHGLANLTHRQCRLEEAGALGKEFDLIDCSGVLHHLEDPLAGLKSLVSVLRPEGVIYLMLYGKYGRTGVYMLQELFRTLGLGQSPADVRFVRDTLAEMKSDHWVRAYVAEADELKHDTAIVDTFLHCQDRGYSVRDCCDLVRSAGLAVQGWRDNLFITRRDRSAKGRRFTKPSRRCRRKKSGAPWSSSTARSQAITSSSAGRIATRRLTESPSTPSHLSI